MQLVRLQKGAPDDANGTFGSCKTTLHGLMRKKLAELGGGA